MQTYIVEKTSNYTGDSVRYKEYESLNDAIVEWGTELILMTYVDCIIKKKDRIVAIASKFTLSLITINL